MRRYIDRVKKLLKLYTPRITFVIYNFVQRIIHKLKSSLNRIAINKRSEIYEILRQNWENYKTDLYPKDRRMHILRENDVSGMSSENIRLFINEAVRRFAKNGVYLEVGTFQGCSLLSAALFNPSPRCIGIDNFSEFDQNNNNELILKKNLEKFHNPRNIEFYNQDYEECIQYLFSKEPTLNVNVYYYDGKHTYEDQAKGLKIMLPHLSYRCIILVDDINCTFVEEANRAFIKENKDFKSIFKIRTKGNGSDDWWNGFKVISRGI